MAIPFRQIPANLLVPGQYQEIDNSLAGAQEDIKKALIVALKSSTGTAQAGTPVKVLSADAAGKAFGWGSPAAIMAEAFLYVNKVEQLYALPVAEPESGTPWKQVFTIGANVPAAGRICLTINGRRAYAPVSAGNTAGQIAAAIVAACNSMRNNPVQAAGGEPEGIIEFTAIVKGAGGNKNTIALRAEALGVTVTEGAVTQGTGTADLAELPAMLGQQRWNYIAFDFADGQPLRILSDELESRYSAMRQIGGRAFVSLSGTAEEMINKAEQINSPHICLIPRGDDPVLPCEWTARFAATACRILADDPSANTYDTKIPGLYAQSGEDFFNRQKLLEAGISTYRLDPTGAVLIERLVTSYTENTDGGRDTSYLDIQVVETVDAVRTYINAEAKKRFKNWKLASTDENFGAGAKVMTTGIWRSFLASLYQTVFIQEKNWCQDFETYKDSILVYVKTDSKTRLEYRHSPVLIGQFLIGAGLNQFK